MTLGWLGNGLKISTTVSFGQQLKFSTCVKVCTMLGELTAAFIKVFFQWRDARVDPAKPNLVVIVGAALLAVVLLNV